MLYGGGYELQKSGYRPLVLEARTRSGGRNWSLRGGHTVVEADSLQHVAWDRDERPVFQSGTGAIAFYHEGILAAAPRPARASCESMPASVPSSASMRHTLLLPYRSRR